LSTVNDQIFHKYFIFSIKYLKFNDLEISANIGLNCCKTKIQLGGFFVSFLTFSTTTYSYIFAEISNSCTQPVPAWRKLVVGICVYVHICCWHTHIIQNGRKDQFIERHYTRGDFAHLSSSRMQHNKFVVSQRSPIRDAAQRSSSTRRPAGGRNGPRRRVYRYSHAQESALAACVASRASLRFPERVDWS